MLVETLAGGSDVDSLEGLIVNADNEPVIVGETSSVDLNTTENALQSAYLGNSDVFLVKFSSDYTVLQMLTYWGSSEEENHVEI